MDEMTMEAALRSLIQNTIHLTIGGQIAESLGVTRFGGRPDVPADFVWPYFETSTYNDDTVKPRPLSFLAQFRCQDLAPLDTEHLLPEDGLLSFFYQLDSQWFDPKDPSYFRVYWFPEGTALSTAAFPEDLEDGCRLPALKIRFETRASLPDWSDFQLHYMDLNALDNWRKKAEQFEAVNKRLEQELGIVGRWDQKNYSRLLGWPILIQGSAALECEMAAVQLLGNSEKPVSEDAVEQARKAALEWRLLFQLDSFEDQDSGFELMFGDCGSIYFYIRQADLAARRFDRGWLIFQCY